MRFPQTGFEHYFGATLESIADFMVHPEKAKYKPKAQVNIA